MPTNISKEKKAFNLQKVKLLIPIILFLFPGCVSFNISPERGSALSSLLILKENINKLLNSGELSPVITGIKIINLDRNEIIFQSNSNKLLHPASTNKLFTAAAAFHYLKPDYTFKTRIYTDGDVENDVLKGNIYLKGDGDPDLKTEHIVQLVEDIYPTIRRIEGDIIADESLFDDLRKSTGWMWDDGPFQWWPPIGALTVNDNTISLHISPGDQRGAPVIITTEPQTDYMKIINNAITNENNDLTITQQWMVHKNTIEITGTISINSPEFIEKRTVENPALYAAQLFKKILNEKGIECTGIIKPGITPENGKILSVYESGNLTSSIKNFLKISDNLTGEMLIKKMSSTVMNRQGTTADGVSLVKKFLASEAGIDTLMFSYSDGSGVSRYNLVSADIEADLLTYIYRNKTLYNLFLECLPIGGIDLRENNFPKVARGKVFAKPGSLSGVSSLTGYALNRDKEIIAFSIIMSGFIDSSHIYQNIQNEIIGLITNFVYN